MITVIIALVAFVPLCLVRIVPPVGWRIVDGDTIERCGRRYRLQGYDAPEWDQPHGAQARKALTAMLATRWSLTVTVGIDHYGRRLVRVLTARGPVASRMILGGHGHAEDVLGGMLQIAPRITGHELWHGRDAVHPKTWRKANPRPRRLPRGVGSS